MIMTTTHKMTAPTNDNAKALRPNGSPDNSPRSPSAEDQSMPLSLTETDKHRSPGRSRHRQPALLLSILMLLAECQASFRQPFTAWLGVREGYPARVKNTGEDVIIVRVVPNGYGKDVSYLANDKQIYKTEQLQDPNIYYKKDGTPVTIVQKIPADAGVALAGYWKSAQEYFSPGNLPKPTMPSLRVKLPPPQAGMPPPIQAPKVSQVVQRSAAVPDDLQARLIRDFEATLNKSRPQHPLSKPTPPPTLVPPPPPSAATLNKSRPQQSRSEPTPPRPVAPSPVAASSPSSSATASDSSESELMPGSGENSAERALRDKRARRKRMNVKKFYATSNGMPGTPLEKK